MRFGDYLDAYSLFKLLSKHCDSTQGTYRKMTREQYYDFLQADTREELTNLRATILEMELPWWEAGRPYYNVWPTMLESLLRINIDDIPTSSLAGTKHPTLELRLPKNAVEGVEAALVSLKVRGALLTAKVYVDFTSEGSSFSPEAVQLGSLWRDCVLVETSKLDTTSWSEFKYPLQGEEQSEICKRFEQSLRDIIHISIATMLLQYDENAVTPCILKKDESKYILADEQRKQELVDKAIRRQGRVGYDVGKICETSAHWRRPHLAKYWVGKGRTIARIQMRAGCIVKSREQNVPTGYRSLEVNHA